MTNNDLICVVCNKKLNGYENHIIYHLMDTEIKQEQKENTIKKIVNGKEYNIHMPSDPAEENVCDGCQ